MKPKLVDTEVLVDVRWWALRKAQKHMQDEQLKPLIVSSNDGIPHQQRYAYSQYISKTAGER